MLFQAAGLALIAGLTPTALLVAAVYLGSAPRLIAGFYLMGAVFMSVVIAIAALVVIRGAALSHSSEHDPRYALRLALGILLVSTGALMATRKRREEQPTEAKQGFVSRLVSNPSPRSAFLVGILVFASCGAFLGAVQVIATARASVELTALGIVMVVLINVMLVWLPFLLHLVAPERTSRYLGAFNSWLRAHGRVVLVSVLVAAGSILIANGINGLT